jgi:hypothetical protein
MNRAALFLAIAVLIGLTICMAAPLVAQVPPCLGVADALAAFHAQGMVLTGTGQTFAGGPVQMWVAPSGAWAVTIEQPGGLICLLATGAGAPRV